MSTKTCKEIQAGRAPKYLHWARKYGAVSGVDPYLILAYAKHESGFTPDIYNKSCRKKNPLSYATVCAAGLTQMPYKYYTKYVSSPGQLLDPETNIRVFAASLARLIKKFGSEYKGMLAGHWGYGNMIRHVRGDSKYRVIPSRPKRYVNSVMALRDRYKSCLGGVGASAPGGSLTNLLLLGAASGLGWLLYKRLKG